MFKAIKEFFVGKPKVEEPVVQAPVVVSEPAPVVEEIKPETITISVTDSMDVSVNTIPDTITLSTPTDLTTWPFPTVPPVEAEVKKKRTPVKREETATKKKPAPAITATKPKPRKKK